LAAVGAAPRRAALSSEAAMASSACHRRNRRVPDQEPAVTMRPMGSWDGVDGRVVERLVDNDKARPRDDVLFNVVEVG